MLSDTSNEIVFQILTLTISAKGLVALCLAFPVSVILLVIAYRLLTYAK